MRHLLLVIVFLMLAFPVVAQDATREPTPLATVDPTVEGPRVINVQPASDNSLLGVIILVGGGIIAVVVTISFGLQAIGNRAAQAANNPLEVAVLEKAHDSIPSAVVETIIKPLKESLERSDDALRKMIILFEKISDRIPEASKTKPPAAPSDFTSTPTQNLP